MAKKTAANTTAKSATRKKNPSPKPAPPPTPSSKVVACWEDDPGDPKIQPALTPITVPVPTPSTQPLGFKISGTAPSPVVYPPGTANFRYYAAACALRRTATFWGSIIPAGTKWQVGALLPVELDTGVDLNAYYTRGGSGDTPGLHFFHDAVSGRTYFSDESPDVVCHEMGHAVLDAIKPQLWDAQTIEAAAFHESFGDMSAILSALQVPSFRAEVISETGGTLNRNSRLSRLAEQLGAAIRIQHPDAVDADCLRNAVNSFFYKDPQTLPTQAPSNSLSSEPHSFSRVFTAGFLDALAGIFKTQGDATPDNLLKASHDAANILVTAIVTVPVVPDFFSQVAAHMLAAAQSAPFSGKYVDVLKSAFVRRGILSLSAISTISNVKAPVTRAALLGPTKNKVATELPKAAISASDYGLSSRTLQVHTAEDPKRFAVTSASLTMGPVEPRSAQNAAESFTEDLFQRGRVDVGNHAHAEAALTHPFAFRTHVVIEEQGDLVLKRKSFDCGFQF